MSHPSIAHVSHLRAFLKGLSPSPLQYRFQPRTCTNRHKHANAASEIESKQTAVLFLLLLLRLIEALIAHHGLELVATLHQSCITSLCFQFSSFEQENQIGIFDRSHPVRNGQNRTLPFFPYIAERLLEGLFTLTVQGTCTFVEQKETWFADERTCDGQTLLLTTGKLGGGNEGIVAFLEG